MDDKTLEDHIIAGVKFFRGLKKGDQKTTMVQKYLPKFEEYVEEYLIKLREELFQ